MGRASTLTRALFVVTAAGFGASCTPTERTDTHDRSADQEHGADPSLDRATTTRDGIPAKDEGRNVDWDEMIGSEVEQILMSPAPGKCDESYAALASTRCGVLPDPKDSARAPDPPARTRHVAQ